MVTHDMKILLNSRDAALVCGISTRLWQVWHRMGYTPMPVLIGKRNFWKHKELEEWIAAGCPKRELWMQSRKKLK